MGADKAGARYGKAGTGVLDDNGQGCLRWLNQGEAHTVDCVGSIPKGIITVSTAIIQLVHVYLKYVCM